MLNQVVLSHLSSKSLSADFPCLPGSQGWNGRERERRIQKTPTQLRYSLSFPCSNLLHVLGKESTSPGSTTSCTELDRPPQGAPLHPFSVTPVDKQGKRHQSLGRDQAGENNGESCLKRTSRLRTKITEMVGAVEQFQAFYFFLMEKVLL